MSASDTRRNAHAPDAERLIIDALGWAPTDRTRAAPLIETLTVPVLLDAIQRKDTKSLLALTTQQGANIFRQDEAQSIIDRLGDAPVKYALERVSIHDLPRLQVRRSIPDGRGGKRFLVRDFTKLSLGQQQSVLLALMLSSTTDRPLIIDQPEDNLDGEFIYKTLVPVLRRAKERRQVIIVTHNANVAVLGDAELIVVMKAMSDHGKSPPAAQSMMQPHAKRRVPFWKVRAKRSFGAPRCTASGFPDPACVSLTN